ncbi:MAG: rhodanese-like domain-containing protein [Saprospiraceae bacterium]|nr:rhodanese-like domain-containing protein [Saprospiraceae bacterium]
MIEIDRKQLEQWTEENKEFVLIDVRESHEHRAYNIGGLLIPLSEISSHYDRFDTDLPVVIYCQRGIRSQIAIQRLQSRFPKVKFYNLTQGVKE